MSIYEICRLVLLLIIYLPVSAIGHGHGHWGALSTKNHGILNVTCGLALGEDGRIESVKCSNILLSCEPKLGPNYFPSQLLCSVVKREGGRKERWEMEEETTLPNSTSIISSTSSTDRDLARPESTASPTSPFLSPWWLLLGLAAIIALNSIAGVCLWRICQRCQQAAEISEEREADAGIGSALGGYGRDSQSPQKPPRMLPRINSVGTGVSIGHRCNDDGPRPLASPAAGRRAAARRPSRHRVAAIERAAPSSASSSTDPSDYRLHAHALHAVERRMRTGEEYSAGSLLHIRRQRRAGRAVKDGSNVGFGGGAVPLGQGHHVETNRGQQPVASVAGRIPHFQQPRVSVIGGQPSNAGRVHPSQQQHRAGVIGGQPPVANLAGEVHPRQQLRAGVIRWQPPIAGGVHPGQQHQPVPGGQQPVACVTAGVPIGHQRRVGEGIGGQRFGEARRLFTRDFTSRTSTGPNAVPPPTSHYRFGLSRQD